jgi:hypothetical protein
MQTQQEEAVQYAQKGSTNLQREMVTARTALRASTGLLQDKPLKHPALPAVWGNTAWEQEDPVKLPAQPVPRTRFRLLRAELEQTAPATQGTVVTPAQEHAQRA